MQEFLKKIPIWLIALSTLGLFGLLAYSVYDNRSVKLGPFEIGARHVESMPVEPQQPLLTPDFDSNWFEIGTCQVRDMTDKLDAIGFSTLPALLTAYYKVTVNGEDTIIPWGVSQYGGEWSTEWVNHRHFRWGRRPQIGVYMFVPLVTQKAEGTTLIFCILGGLRTE